MEVLCEINGSLLWKQTKRIRFDEYLVFTLSLGDGY